MQTPPIFQVPFIFQMKNKQYNEGIWALKKHLAKHGKEQRRFLTLKFGGEGRGTTSQP